MLFFFIEIIIADNQIYHLKSIPDTYQKKLCRPMFQGHRQKIGYPGNLLNMAQYQSMMIKAMKLK